MDSNNAKDSKAEQAEKSSDEDGSSDYDSTTSATDSSTETDPEPLSLLNNGHADRKPHPSSSENVKATTAEEKANEPSEVGDKNSNSLYGQNKFSSFMPKHSFHERKQEAQIEQETHRLKKPKDLNRDSTLRDGGESTDDNLPASDQMSLEKWIQSDLRDSGLPPPPQKPRTAAMGIDTSEYSYIQPGSSLGVVSRESSSSYSTETSEDESEMKMIDRSLLGGIGIQGSGSGTMNKNMLDSTVCEMNLNSLDDEQLQKLVDIYCNKSEQDLEGDFGFDENPSESLEPSTFENRDSNGCDAVIIEKKRAREVELESKREYLQKRCSLGSGSPYKPSNYESLVVSKEIKELFPFISHTYYNLMNMDMSMKLMPFIPDYYPCVGDVDGMLKVVETSMPTLDEDGLKCLDEIVSNIQSDPAVLTLKLKSTSKQILNELGRNLGDDLKIVSDKKRDKAVIEKWIEDVSLLQEKKPSPTYRPQIPMPSIDELLEPWPAEMETVMTKVLDENLDDIDCTNEEFVDLICNLLDIPVGTRRIDSVYVLATLYAEQKHYLQNKKNLEAENPLESLYEDDSSVKSSELESGDQKEQLEHYYQDSVIEHAQLSRD